jgi:hypothetical protein
MDDLLEKISRKGTPGWVWVLVVVSFFLASARKFSSRRLRTKKRLLEVEKAREAAKALSDKSMAAAAAFLKFQTETRAKVRKIDGELYKLSEATKRDRRRILAARSLTELQ